jgi:hypothetical protein
MVMFTRVPVCVCWSLHAVVLLLVVTQGDCERDHHGRRPPASEPAMRTHQRTRHAKGPTPQDAQTQRVWLCRKRICQLETPELCRKVNLKKPLYQRTCRTVTPSATLAGRPAQAAHGCLSNQKHLRRVRVANPAFPDAGRATLFRSQKHVSQFECGSPVSSILNLLFDSFGCVCLVRLQAARQRTGCCSAQAPVRASRFVASSKRTVSWSLAPRALG